MLVEHDNDGTLTLIEQGSIEIVEKILKEFNPELIVELGIYKAGFTKYLAKWFPNTPIYGFDIAWMISGKDARLFRDLGNVSIIITQSIFRNDFCLPLLLSSPVKKFFLCDNGQKEDELKLYAGYLRPGDLLGVHDWGTEVKPEVVEAVLKEFDEHPVNAQLDDPDKSLFRFFVRKSHKGCLRVPNGFEDKA